MANLKGIKIDFGLDNKMPLKLRAIDKYTEALANELDTVDATKCKTCGGPLDITKLYSGDEVLDTSAYCRNCRD